MRIDLFVTLNHQHQHGRLLQVATHQLVQRVEGEGACLVLHHLYVRVARVSTPHNKQSTQHDAVKRVDERVLRGAVHAEEKGEQQLAAR